MQRSSESIASLAAALAKAQTELVNPEKSLVGTIPAENDGGAERTFRYASLASGLDIVRKILGEHEIATIQTTAIDQEAGIVNLTTVLAHSSGEWIASDWPVCAISDTATSHRMGAALTYARRYALFTLVGIAGEDDLDAPDLLTPSNQAERATQSEQRRAGKYRPLNGRQGAVTQRAGAAVRPASKAACENAQPILRPEESVQLRDRLIAEITAVGSSEDAALWAHRRLAEKNTLTAADAKHVEEFFEKQVAAFATAAPELPNPLNAGTSFLAPAPDRDRSKRGSPSAIDKSALAWPELRRLRDRNHVKSVAKRPCLICGRQPADAHHLRFAQSRALGRKVSDEFTVPLCRGHHREVHRCSDEAEWWSKAGIDPTMTARALWLETHPLSTDQANLPADLARSATARMTEQENGKIAARTSEQRTGRATESTTESRPQNTSQAERQR